MKLTFSHVSASYTKNGPPVLCDLTFQAAEGRRLIVLGENGSGKTTLLRILAGVLPYEGSVMIDGCELRTLKREAHAAKIAHLRQLSSAAFSYTVRETVAQGRYIRMKGGPLFRETAKEKDAVTRFLAETDLTALSDRRIDTLSGGQLQRVFLARALAQETPLLLLDEPTSHLDLRVQAELLSYLAQWSARTSALPDGSVHQNTLIGVFHDLALAMRLAEDVLLLKEGRILAHGEAKRILTDETLMTEAFDFDVLSFLNERTG